MVSGAHSKFFIAGNKNKKKHYGNLTQFEDARVNIDEINLNRGSLVYEREWLENLDPRDVSNPGVILRKKRFDREVILQNSLDSLNSRELEIILNENLLRKRYRPYICNPKILNPGNLSIMDVIPGANLNTNRTPVKDKEPKTSAKIDFKKDHSIHQMEHKGFYDDHDGLGEGKDTGFKTPKTFLVKKHGYDDTKGKINPYRAGDKFYKEATKNSLKFDNSYATIMLFLAYLEKDIKLYYKVRQFIFFYEKNKNSKMNAIMRFLDTMPDEVIKKQKANPLAGIFTTLGSKKT